MIKKDKNNKDNMKDCNYNIKKNKEQTNKDSSNRNNRDNKDKDNKINSNYSNNKRKIKLVVPVIFSENNCISASSNTIQYKYYHLKSFIFLQQDIIC
mmetsp:Transcript_5796/g.820  ORF Transcript_5796/g.820 Transcript_5796/m.820 type:complete len:97 (-) Transcript_5796:1-291(-)